jgi:hypothetical protein
MFIADCNKFYDTIYSDLVDPIFNTRIDVFDVFTHICRKDDTIFDYIYKKNFTEFKQKKFIKYDIFNNIPKIPNFALVLEKMFYSLYIQNFLTSGQNLRFLGFNFF